MPTLLNRPHPVGLGLALGCLLLGSSCLPMSDGWEPRPTCEELLTGWDLPSDLCTRQKQLDHLELPSNVERIDWITRPVASLSLADAPIRSVAGLPHSIRRLYLPNARHLTTLAGLPDRVEELDVRWVELGSLEGLPPGLDSLAVSWLYPEDFSHLPEGLERLTLLYESSPELRSLDGLPSSIEHLELVGRAVRSLKGLPENVESLLLQTVRLQYTDLPPHIRSLEIRKPIKQDLSPQTTDLRQLPEFLESLSLKKVDFTGTLADNAPYLHRVELLETPPHSLDQLPQFLAELHLDHESTPETFTGAPSGLRALRLWATDLENDTLPAGLEELVVEGYRGSTLPELPRSLRTLQLHFSDVQSLSGAPAGLRELDVTGWSQPGARPDLGALFGVFDELNRLKWRASPLKRLQGLSEALPRLESLDLSASRDLRSIDSLPVTLKVLRVGNCELIERLPTPLPPALALLDIRGTGIDHLPEIQAPLRTLIVNRGQLTSLERMPATVRNLVILDPSDPAPALDNLPE